MKPMAVIAVLLLAVSLSIGADEKKKKEKSPEVEIKGMKFDPPTLKIKTGEKVLWTNDDDRDHTVTADDGKSFKSGNIKRGATFEQKFPKPGKYPYSCSYHPRMKGTIVVTDP